MRHTKVMTTEHNCILNKTEEHYHMMHSDYDGSIIVSVKLVFFLVDTKHIVYKHADNCLREVSPRETVMSGGLGQSDCPFKTSIFYILNSIFGNKIVILSKKTQKFSTN